MLACGSSTVCTDVSDLGSVTFFSCPTTTRGMGLSVAGKERKKEESIVDCQRFLARHDYLYVYTSHAYVWTTVRSSVCSLCIHLCSFRVLLYAFLVFSPEESYQLPAAVLILRCTYTRRLPSICVQLNHAYMSSCLQISISVCMFSLSCL